MLQDGYIEDALVTLVEPYRNLLKVWCQISQNNEIENAIGLLKDDFGREKYRVKTTSLEVNSRYFYKFKHVWYRCQIISFVDFLTEADQAIVNFIDHGKTEQVPLDQFFSCDGPALDIRPQAREYILDEVKLTDINWSRKSLDYCNNNLVNQQVTVEVTGKVEEIPLALIYLKNKNRYFNDMMVQADMASKESPKNQKDMAFIVLPLNVDKYYPSYVIHVTKNARFFIQTKESRRRYKWEKMMDEISYLPLQLHSGPQHPGTPVLANSIDQERVCRGLIQSMNHSFYIICFVDYGNTEMKKKEEIFVLPEKFLKIPILAHECVAKNGNKCTEISNIEEGNEIDCYILSDDKPYKVYVNLSSSEAKFVNIDLTVGNKYEIVPIYVKQISGFYVKLKKYDCKYVELKSTLQEKYKEDVTEDDLEIVSGDACCVNSSDEQNTWVRGEIASVNHNCVHIYMVDTGRHERFKNKRVIRRISREDIYKLPALAIKCSLFGISDENESLHSRELKETFIQMVLNSKNVVAEVININKGCPQLKITVENDSSSFCVNDELLKQLNLSDMKVQISKLPLNQAENIFVTYFQSVDKFYGHLSRISVDDLYNLEMSLSEYGSSERLFSNKIIAVGDVCCAKYALDQKFYRGKVISLMESSAMVYFVDYGNCDECLLCDMKLLTPQLAAIPKMGIMCSCKETLTFISTQTSLKNMIYDKNVEVELISLLDEETYQVRFTNSPINKGIYQSFVINEDEEEYVKKKKRHTEIPMILEYRYPIYDSVETAELVHIRSWNQMFFHLKRYNEELNNVAKAVALAMTKIGEESVEEYYCGTPCLALFSKDKNWYRAIILTVAPEDSYIVEFVDFGNCGTVKKTDIRSIPDYLLTTPRLTFECVLCNNFQNDMPRDLMEKFELETLNKEFTLKFRVSGVTSGKPALFEFADQSGTALVAKYKEAMHKYTQDKFVSNRNGRETDDNNKWDGSDGGQVKQWAPMENVRSNSKEGYQRSSGPNGHENGEFSNAFHSRNGNGNFQRNNPGGNRHHSNEGHDQRNRNESGTGNWSNGSGGYRSSQRRFDAPSVDVEIGHDGYGRFKSKSGFENGTDRNGRPQQQPDTERNARQTNHKEYGWSNGTNDHRGNDFKSSGTTRETQNYRGNSNFSRPTSSNVNRVSSWDESRDSKAAKPELVDITIEMGSFKEISVSYVVTPNEFYCNLVDLDAHKKYRDMSVKLNAKCNDSSSSGVMKCEVGTPCGACFSEDGQWYRAKVISVNNTDVEVFFVDFGNREHCQMDTLKALDGEFLSLPARAIKCSLYDIKPLIGSNWEDEDATYFETATALSHFLAHFKSKDQSGTYTIDMMDSFLFDEMSLRYKLMNETNFRPKFTTDLVYLDLSSQVLPLSPYSQIQLQVGQKEEAYVTWVNTPGQFYAHLLSQDQSRQKLDAKLNTFYSALTGNEWVVVAPERGMACVTTFEFDGTKGFYRALVLAVDGSEVLVLYVDFGNIGRVPFHEVKQIEVEFLELPAQALLLNLIGIKPLGTNWKNVTQENLAKYFGGNLSFTVVECRNQGYAVEVVVKDKDVATQIITDGLACFDDQYYSLISPNIKSVVNMLMAEDESVSKPDEIKIYNVIKDSSTTVEEIDAVDDIKIDDVNVIVEECEDSTGVIDAINIETNTEPSRLCVGDCIMAVISFSASADLFYIQYVTDADNLNTLSSNLNALYSDTEPEEELNLKVGSMCVAHFSDDDNWYRATIIGERDFGYELLYIDYGNTGWELLERIRHLPSSDVEWVNQKPYAYLCSLEDFPLFCEKEKATQVFNRVLTSGEFNVEVSVVRVEGEKCFVNLKSSGIDVSQAIREECGPIEIISLEEECDIEAHNVLKVVVSHFESPSQIWVQRKSDTEKLSKLAKVLATCAETALTITEPLEINSVVLYCSSQAYRVAVTSVSDDSAIVNFIDYGNSDVVILDDLKHLPESFSNIPALAMECNLCGVVKPEEGWPQDVLELLQALEDEGTLLNAKIISFDNDVYSVELYDSADGKNYAELISQRIADSSAVQSNVEKRTFVKYNLGEKVEIMITTIVSPFKFWVQKVADESELQKLFDDLNQSCKELEEGLSDVTKFQIDEICAAKFSEDEFWYRGQILSEVNDAFLILFIDFGNCELTMRKNMLKLEDPYFLNAPRFAVKCDLSGNGKWSDEAAKLFKAEYETKSCLGEFLEMKEDGSYVVRLLDMGIDVEKKLLGQLEQDEQEIEIVYEALSCVPDNSSVLLTSVEESKEALTNSYFLESSHCSSSKDKNDILVVDISSSVNVSDVKSETGSESFSKLSETEEKSVVVIGSINMVEAVDIGESCSRKDSVVQQPILSSEGFMAQLVIPTYSEFAESAAVHPRSVSPSPEFGSQSQPAVKISPSTETKINLAGKLPSLNDISKDVNSLDSPSVISSALPAPEWDSQSGSELEASSSSEIRKSVSEELPVIDDMKTLKEKSEEKVSCDIDFGVIASDDHPSKLVSEEVSEENVEAQATANEDQKPSGSKAGITVPSVESELVSETVVSYDSDSDEATIKNSSCEIDIEEH